MESLSCVVIDESFIHLLQNFTNICRILLVFLVVVDRLEIAGIELRGLLHIVLW